MSHKYRNLRQQILTLQDLHKNWLSIDIANELQSSDCRPPQTRHVLVRFINYTIFLVGSDGLPRSKASTVQLWSGSLNLAAIIDPHDPTPTTMKSYSRPVSVLTDE